MALDNSSISRARRFSDGAASRYGSTAVHTDAGSVVDRPLTRVPADCVAGCVACVVVGDGKLRARMRCGMRRPRWHGWPGDLLALQTARQSGQCDRCHRRRLHKPPLRGQFRRRPRRAAWSEQSCANCPRRCLLRPALPANHGLFIGTPATTALDALADEFYQFRRAGRMEVLVEHRRGSAPGGCTRHRPRVIVSSVPSVLSVPLGRWHVREDRGSGCQGERSGDPYGLPRCCRSPARMGGSMSSPFE